MATTPPMASLPYSDEAGPRSTSTRCRNAGSTKLRPESEKLPTAKPPASRHPVDFDGDAVAADAAHREGVERRSGTDRCARESPGS